MTRGGISRTSLVVGACMIAASMLALVLKPTHRATHGEHFELGTMLPAHFGDWKIDPTVMPVEVSPDVQAVLDKTYDQVLSRTYRDSRGRRVMVSLVYGSNQLTEATQAHRPEYCYTNQGFDVVANAVAELPIGDRSIRVRKLVAIQGPRQEPITYWMTVGDRVVLPGLDRKVAQLQYGVTGRIPDGVLMRLSSIGGDWNAEFVLQEKFAADLIDAMRPDDRPILVGTAGPRGQLDPSHPPPG